MIEDDVFRDYTPSIVTPTNWPICRVDTQRPWSWIMFFGALNTLGFGPIGAYTWRCYEKSNGCPLAIIQSAMILEGTASKTKANVVQ